jgi:hypothetical protein
MFYKTIQLQLEKYKTKIDYSKPIEEMFTDYLHRLNALHIDPEDALDQIRNHLLAEKKYQCADLAYGDDYQNEVLGMFIDLDACLREHDQDPGFLYSPAMLFFAVYEKNWNGVYHEVYQTVFSLYKRALEQNLDLPVFYNTIFKDFFDGVLKFAVSVQYEPNAKALILDKLKAICEMLA